ncbi:MAG: hypothetical protein ABIG96_01935 [Candidatus Micrarchaeota archaeon]
MVEQHSLGSHSSNIVKSAMRLAHKHRILLLLLAAIAFSVFTHWMVMREWHMPTYGNTMIHVASARHTIEYQQYPLEDYSYGGGIPNLYVPFYRMLVASFAILTGFSLDLTSRILVLIFAILLPLGFYLLGRKLFGETVGMLSAFLSVLPGELLIYTVRPLPQAYGLVLLPFAFHAYYKRDWLLSVFLTFAIALIHQEAIAFLVGGIGMYFGFIILHMIWKVLISQPFDAAKHSQILKISFFIIIFALATYLLWQFVMIGHFNIFELAQFKNHEGNTTSMDLYLLKTGVLVSTFSLIGLFVCAAIFVRFGIRDLQISEELRNALVTFLVFLLAAFGSYFVLNNFSLSRNVSLVSISFPFFLGPLEGMEIAAISLFAGVVAVLMVKGFDHSKFYKSNSSSAYLFLFALFAAGFFAVKNDAIGLRVFMDRFLVYLQQPLVVLAALGINSILDFFRHLRDFHLP